MWKEEQVSTKAAYQAQLQREIRKLDILIEQTESAARQEDHRSQIDLHMELERWRARRREAQRTLHLLRHPLSGELNNAASEPSSAWNKSFQE